MWKLAILNIISLIKITDKILFFIKYDDKLITYISYNSNKEPLNFILISKEINRIKKHDIREVFLVREFKNTWTSKISYIKEILKQVYYVKKSKIVIVDGNNIVISNIKNKNSKIIQIWHACGAIKKFGNDYKRRYKIKNYDYVITASEQNRKSFASAFGIGEDKIKVLGYPAIDILFNTDKMEKYRYAIRKKYGLENKKIILYAPTFRGEAIYGMKEVEIDLDNISRKIGDKYTILYKAHPIINKEKKYYENVIDVSKENLYELFSISDILISDFSSIIYEFSILEKPIILYVPDLTDYENERGLYIDYENFMPRMITHKEDEIVKIIIEEDFDLEDVKMLKKKFFRFKDKKSSRRIAKFILENI